jgi:hypothetical protein
LYTYHSINQCERCKDLFGTVKELEDHTLAEPGCPSRTVYPVDGITRKIKEQLQCRKKAYPGQTESERWVRIYEILFNPMPNEVIPSPCKLAIALRPLFATDFSSPYLLY